MRQAGPEDGSPPRERPGSRALAPRRPRAWAQTGGTPRQATLRIPLPGWLLALVAQDLAAAERRFGPLERAVHRFVFRFLPRGAAQVRLAWDDVRLEVVASFVLAARERHGS